MGFNEVGRIRRNSLVGYSILSFLFPGSLLPIMRWRQSFFAQERENFYGSSKVFFILVSVNYIAHYFFLDVPLGLAEDPKWAIYRFAMTSISLSLLLVNRFLKMDGSLILYKIPTAMACLVFTYFQARTIIWYDQVPYFYIFVFILLANFVLAMDPINTILYNVVATTLTYPSVIDRGISQEMAISAYVLCYIFSLFIINLKVNKYKLYRSLMANIDKEKKIAEQQIELNDLIKQFIPSALYVRIQRKMRSQSISPMVALEEVLTQQTKQVAILYTDIRCFSKSVNDSFDFLRNDIIDSIQRGSEIVTHFAGIQRKIGDLLFSYFDYDRRSNLLLSLTSAAYIVRGESEVRKLSGKAPVRQVILTFGTATVGNLSDIESCPEITAMGIPSNESERIDSAIKESVLANEENLDVVVCSEDFYLQFIDVFFDQIQFEQFSLEKNSIVIKDFPSKKRLYLFRVNETNMTALLELYDSQANQSQESDYYEDAVA